MIIGILSDTHDRLPAMQAGMAVLRANGAEYFIHCGDVGSEQILDELVGVRAAFVFGNNDFDRPRLERYAQVVGIQCLGAFGQLELDGKRIAVMHGDDFARRRSVLAEQSCDYLLFGHSHVQEDFRSGKVRLINPGALHRANPKTVATLDLQADVVKFITV